jgi:predicted Kef-type K+ transport protein
MKSSKGGVVLRVARWVVAHRGRVAIGWVAVLALAMIASHAAKPHYVNNLSLPGTESQRGRRT